MPKYIVHVREVWIQPVEVNIPDDIPPERIEPLARVKVKGGYGVTLENRFEFSHRLDSSLWTVEEAEEEL